MQTSIPLPLGLLALSLVSTPAFARRNGIAGSCDGCHGSEKTSQATLTASPMDFGPDDDVVFTLSVRSDGMKGAGVYVEAPSAGELSTIAGEGLTLSSAGVTHSAPKEFSGDSATFRFGWRAPSTAGAVTFAVYLLGTNLDGRQTGDAPGSGRFGFTYGCEAQTFYYDGDRDGFASDERLTQISCAGEPPAAYTAELGDCNDSVKSVFPGAQELCNRRDDDCDGEIDEGSAPIPLWPDSDGDGYHDSTGDTIMGCVPYKGYAALAGDCAPNDATRNPGATEICNLLDENCDGRIDERVRPQCGAGWCARDSVSCEPEDCTPGMPTEEKCNLFDDDCNGIVDDGELCAPGSACLAGSCVVLEGGGGQAASAGRGGGPSVSSGGGPSVSSGGAPNGSGASSTVSGASSSPTGGVSPSAGAGAGVGSGGRRDDASKAPAASGCSASRPPRGRTLFPLAALSALVWLTRRRAGISATPARARRVH